MNIGYIYSAPSNFQSAGEVQSWQIFKRLKKNNQLYTQSVCPHDGAIKTYFSKRDIFRFVNKIDLLFIIINGFFNFHDEKFTLLKLLSGGRVPVVWFINAPVQESLVMQNYDMSKYGFDFASRKFLSRFVDLAIFVSNDLKRAISKDYQFPHERVIPNGGELQWPNKVHHNNSALANFNNKFIVLWQGNGEYPWHALDTLIKAAEKMFLLDPSVVFVIMTNNSWYPIKSLPNIVWIHNAPFFDLPSYIRDADLCLALYHHNYGDIFYNSSMKLFDYMSLGKPIIATGIGQINEVIQNGQNGLTIQNNSDELCHAILRYKKSKKLRDLLGAEAKKSVQTYYNWDRAAEEIEDELQNLNLLKSH